MRPACCELETYGLYFTLAYGGFCHSSYSQHTLSACLLWPAQHVNARTHDVFMMTVNDNKFPKLPFFSFFKYSQLKNNLSNKTVSGLKFYVTCQVSRKTRCLMHLILASSNARKKIPVKKKIFPQNLLYTPNVKPTQNFLSASIKTDGYAKLPLFSAPKFILHNIAVVTI